MIIPTDGIVTFLFTDIESSTRLWEQQPEAMATALSNHDRLLQELITEYGGQVFKTVGDAFFAAFAIPSEAISAALAIQRAILGENWG